MRKAKRFFNDWWPLLVVLYMALAAVLLLLTQPFSAQGQSLPPSPTPTPAFHPLDLTWEGYYTSDVGVTLDDPTVPSGVTSWESQEGGGTLEQGVAESMPQLVPAYFDSGRPALRFSGGQFLQDTTSSYTFGYGYIVALVNVTADTAEEPMTLLSYSDGTHDEEFAALLRLSDSMPNVTLSVLTIDGDVFNLVRRTRNNNPEDGQFWIEYIRRDTLDFYEIQMQGNTFPAVDVVTGLDDGTWWDAPLGADTLTIGASSATVADWFASMDIGFLGIMDGATPTGTQREQIFRWFRDEWMAEGSAPDAPLPTPAPPTATPEPTWTPVPACGTDTIHYWNASGPVGEAPIQFEEDATAYVQTFSAAGHGRIDSVTIPIVVGASGTDKTAQALIVPMALPVGSGFQDTDPNASSYVALQGPSWRELAEPVFSMETALGISSGLTVEVGTQPPQESPGFVCAVNGLDAEWTFTFDPPVSIPRAGVYGVMVLVDDGTVDAYWQYEFDSTKNYDGGRIFYGTYEVPDDVPVVEEWTAAGAHIDFLMAVHGRIVKPQPPLFPDDWSGGIWTIAGLGGLALGLGMLMVNTAVGIPVLAGLGLVGLVVLAQADIIPAVYVLGAILAAGIAVIVAAVMMTRKGASNG